MTGILMLVAILVVVQILQWVVKSKFAAPPRITLERGGSFKNEAAVNAMVRPLLAEGFKEVGTYVAMPMKLTLKALCHPTEQAWAVAYDKFRNVDPWLDLVTRYEDGGSITYANTTNQAMTQLDKRPGHDKVNVPGADPVGLWRRFLGERPRKPMTALRPQDFKMRFETAYAEEMAWRNARGGATEEEIRRVAAASGMNVNDAQVAQARQEMSRQAERARSSQPK